MPRIIDQSPFNSATLTWSTSRILILSLLNWTLSYLNKLTNTNLWKLGGGYASADSSWVMYLTRLFCAGSLLHKCIAGKYSYCMSGLVNGLILWRSSWLMTFSQDFVEYQNKIGTVVVTISRLIPFHKSNTPIFKEVLEVAQIAFTPFRV